MSSWQNLSSLALPRQLFGSHRLNSKGVDISDPAAVHQLTLQLAVHRHDCIEAGPILDIAVRSPGAGERRELRSPANIADVVGIVRDATPEEMLGAFDCAADAFQG